MTRLAFAVWLALSLGLGACAGKQPKAGLEEASMEEEAGPTPTPSRLMSPVRKAGFGAAGDFMR
jgi:hypothetical protein